MSNDTLASFLFAQMIYEIEQNTKSRDFLNGFLEMSELGCDALPQCVDKKVIREIERVFAKAVRKYNHKEGFWLWIRRITRSLNSAKLYGL